MTELPDGRARAAKIAFAVAAGVLVVVLGAVFALSLRTNDERVDRQTRIEPAEETSTETSVPPSVEPTEATPPAPAPSEKPTAPGQSRVTKIAFRLGGTVYVANEDGSSAAPVMRAGNGPYALSPDGRTLAVVTESNLVLVPVAGGGQVTLNDAEAARPVWTPDSKSVLWVRGEPDSPGVMTVMRVNADGKGARVLKQGIGASISPDGKAIIVLPLPTADPGGGSSPVHLSLSGGAFKTVKVPGFPTSVAVTNDRLIVGLATAAGDPAVVSMTFSGTDSRNLAGAPVGGAMATWSQLVSSPDGRSVAAVAMGDDGYSRVSVLPIGAGSARQLLPRKDAYFHSWSADGKRLFLIEGNHFQGQSTSLVSVGTDGTGRRVVVTGAEP